MSVYRDKKTKNWVVTLRYTDQTGKVNRRAKRGFKTKREAQEWERLFLNNIDPQESVDIPFEEFYEIYMNDLSNKLRFTTIRTKRNMFETHIIPTFKGMLMTRITPAHIVRWQNDILGKGFSNTYVRTISNQLHAMFNHAHRYYDLNNPPTHKTKPIGSSQADKMNFWTKAEFDQFISFVDSEVSRLHFYVLFYTGMRIGELMAVKVKDLNLDLGHIEINETAIYEKEEYIFSKPKTPKAIRTITIPLFLKDMIIEHIDRYYFIDQDKKVFLTTKDRLTKDMRKYSSMAGVKRIRLHDLRHSHASLLIEQGIQPNIVQERLGHERIETTLRTYSHLYPNKQYHLADFLHQIEMGTDSSISSDTHRSPLLIPTTK